MPFHYVENAALSHLRAWSRHGEPAPELPRISIDDRRRGRPRRARKRAWRHPPSAPRSTGRGVRARGHARSRARLRGFVKPFPPEVLAALYTSRDDYLARFDAAAIDAVESGFLLEPDAVEARALLS